jgi:CPA2 family monovalent cation:H+ antiporter-2
MIGRLSDPDFFEAFSKLNMTNLVYPKLEAGLEMARQVLLALRFPVTEIHRHTEALRQEFFANTINLSKPYQTLAQFRSAEQQFDLQWVNVGPHCKLVGQTIGEAEIRKNTGASVVGVLRNDKLEPNPTPQFQFQERDRVAIIGSPEARASFQSRFFPNR